MSGNNYGKKGKAIGFFFIAIVLLVITMIWVYGMNQNSLPV